VENPANQDVPAKEMSRRFKVEAVDLDTGHAIKLDLHIGIIAGQVVEVYMVPEEWVNEQGRDSETDRQYSGDAGLSPG
jgi:hypothetical protein